MAASNSQFMNLLLKSTRIEPKIGLVAQHGVCLACAGTASLLGSLSVNRSRVECSEAEQCVKVLSLFTHYVRGFLRHCLRIPTLSHVQVNESQDGDLHFRPILTDEEGKTASCASEDGTHMCLHIHFDPKSLPMLAGYFNPLHVCIAMSTADVHQFGFHHVTNCAHNLSSLKGSPGQAQSSNSYPLGRGIVLYGQGVPGWVNGVWDSLRRQDKPFDAQKALDRHTRPEPVTLADGALDLVADRKACEWMAAITTTMARNLDVSIFAAYQRMVNQNPGVFMIQMGSLKKLAKAAEDAKRGLLPLAAYMPSDQLLVHTSNSELSSLGQERVTLACYVMFLITIDHGKRLHNEFDAYTRVMHFEAMDGDMRKRIAAHVVLSREIPVPPCVMTASDADQVRMREQMALECHGCGKKLIMGSHKKCNKCQHATFCDRACFVRDWKRGGELSHRKLCGAMKLVVESLDTDNARREAQRDLSVQEPGQDGEEEVKEEQGEEGEQPGLQQEDEEQPGQSRSD